MGIRAVLWDLDGTLLNSGIEGMRRFFTIARRRGLEVTPEMENQIRSIWSKHGSDFVKILWPDEDAKAFYADWAEYDLKHPHVLTPFARETVIYCWARKVYQAVSTSRNRNTSIAQLDVNDLTDFFCRLSCGDDSVYKKPDPRCCDDIFSDLKKLDKNFRQKTLYVGDTLIDYNLALALNVRPILVLAGSLNTREEFLAEGVPDENILDTLEDLLRMVKISVLEEVLNLAWSRSTSAEPDKWSPSNPAWGQCAVTACLVQDYLGGELLRVTATLPGSEESISHYKNLLSGGKELDLTAGQFPEGTIFSVPPAIRTREYVLDPKFTTLKRYKLLKRRMRKYM